MWMSDANRSVPLEVLSLDALTPALSGAQEPACSLTLQGARHRLSFENLWSKLHLLSFSHLYNKNNNIPLHFYSTLLLTKFFLWTIILPITTKVSGSFSHLINNNTQFQRIYLAFFTVDSQTEITWPQIHRAPNVFYMRKKIKWIKTKRIYLSWCSCSAMLFFCLFIDSSSI